MKNINRFASSFVLSAAIAILPAAALAQGSMGQDSQGSNSQGSMQSGAMSNNLSASDKKFVMDAAKGGMAEVELGKMATEKASSDDVKKFGQRMVDDHTKANEQLKQVASQEGIQLPTALSAKDQMTKEKLSKLSGTAFDKAYMNDMVKDHTKDVADFQKESTNGKDPAVKDFAAQTLPTLQSHLQQAKQIAPATSSSASR
jgi:putative membrane protein